MWQGLLDCVVELDDFVAVELDEIHTKAQSCVRFADDEPRAATICEEGDKQSYRRTPRIRPGPQMTP